MARRKRSSETPSNSLNSNVSDITLGQQDVCVLSRRRLNKGAEQRPPSKTPASSDLSQACSGPLLSETRTPGRKGNKEPRSRADQNAKNTARVGSKQSIVIEMLTRSAGASLEELIAATNWLPHSTRAVLSRLRKGGSEIDRRREVSGTRYYLIVHAAARSA
jgi:hypothetical protein